MMNTYTNPPMVKLLLYHLEQSGGCLKTAGTLELLLSWYDQNRHDLSSPLIPKEDIINLYHLAETLEILAGSSIIGEA